jgi:hypothetical protein
VNQCRFVSWRQKKKEKKKKSKERRTEKRKFLDATETCDKKNVYFVFTLELMLLLLINCISEMLVMEKKGEQQKPTMLKEKERERETC